MGSLLLLTAHPPDSLANDESERALASRAFGASSVTSRGGVVAVTLFANADGSAPTADERSTILSGQYLNDLATGIFSGVSNFTVAGGAGVGDADALALFTGDLGGASWDSVGDAFVKGNVFGAMLYSTPGQADGSLLGILLGFEMSKLP